MVRRPYVFVYRDAKDSVERSLINLARSQIEYSDEDPHDTPHSFRSVAEPSAIPRRVLDLNRDAFSLITYN